MICRHLAALGLAVSVALAACGGGGDDTQEVGDTPQQATPTKLLVIGNSLALHQPAPQIGWNGNWGMAATSADRDYAHQASNGLSLPLVVKNYHDDRNGGTAHLPAYTALTDARTVVVVQLGEDVAHDAAFIEPYKQLLAAMKPANRLVCVGTWWAKAPADEAMSQACTAADGVFVSIADLFTSPANPDYTNSPFEHPGVNLHPHDWGMARIGERVVAAVKR